VCSIHTRSRQPFRNFPGHPLYERRPKSCEIGLKTKSPDGVTRPYGRGLLEMTGLKPGIAHRVFAIKECLASRRAIAAFVWLRRARIRCCAGRHEIYNAALVVSRHGTPSRFVILFKSARLQRKGRCKPSQTANCNYGRLRSATKANKKQIDNAQGREQIRSFQALRCLEDGHMTGYGGISWVLARRAGSAMGGRAFAFRFRPEGACKEV
jgi:hypothetical protein